MANRTRMHEIERGEIMRFLAEIYPSSATPKAILYHMDDSAYSISKEDLDFHINYLAEAGLVEFDIFVREVGEPQAIRSVKITKDGIDRLDKRRAGDLGVRF